MITLESVDIIEGKLIVAKQIAEYYQQKNWRLFFISLDGHERQEAFVDVYKEMPPQDYWKYLGKVIQGECLFNDELKKLLTNTGMDLSLRHLMMLEDDKEILDKLPDTFSIYRGADEGTPGQGWSWSLSKRVALFFAKRFEKGIVIKGECAKKDVIAYFDDRKEQEIVIPYNKVKNIVVLKRTENDHITSTDNVFYKRELQARAEIIGNYAAYKIYCTTQEANVN